MTTLPIVPVETDRRPRRLARFRRALAVRHHQMFTGPVDERGSQITDNLGLIVIGIVAVVAIGGLISGLDTTVFHWVTSQLNVSG